MGGSPAEAAVGDRWSKFKIVAIKLLPITLVWVEKQIIRENSVWM